jgi:integrative and conjugative element protein (TIGR02256 family)
MDRTYKIDVNTVLRIEDKVLNILSKYNQQDKEKSESGGILLGKIRADHSEYIITDISEPCKEDRRGRHFFIRSKANAQNVINKLWEKSRGEIVYLGEWHTHPELHPSPSFTDNNLIKQCSNEIKPLPPIIFLVIVGESGSLYVGSKLVGTSNSSLIKLNEVNRRE